MPPVSFVAPIVLLVGGAVFLTVGIKLYRDHRTFLAGAREADAQVVDLRQRVSRRTVGRDQGIWKPVVRFALPDGRWVEAETVHGSNPPPAQPGQWVRVRYDPEQPTIVNLASGLASGGLLGPVLIVIGGLLGVAGLAVTAVAQLLSGVL